ncbi:methyl-accepting chemotaxis protein [Allopseudospirillum japonicum]|uniref:Methyl-accepting chemotaxis protein n=1 Tax=Allopseudospirillum japonicum TaxID=64971 RepID=A0A1H6ST29_9GAMM|nr:cache domain-containing protein [Allopseudospirillum japonicum]SEI71138.1 methyl-accepting chemotaxis protein [Allopseudospirillum japonicum]
MSSVLANIKIKYKLWSIVVLMGVGTVFLVVLSLWALTHYLMEDRKVKTRHVVETAHSLVEHYYQQAQQGILSTQAAQNAALDALRDMRYGENRQEYFWVNDMQVVIVMHPIKPELDGRNLSGFQDPNGKRLFDEFVRIVREQGEGFVDYLWPKPGQEEPVAKISYVKGFQPWGWVVGNGIYLDDVDIIIHQAVWHYVQTIGVLSLFIGGIALFIIHIITSHIHHLQTTILQVKDSGDLRQRVDVYTHDELGKIAGAYNHLMDQFQNLVNLVSQSTEQLVAASEQMNQATSSTALGMQRQLEDTAQAVATMQQMAASAQESAGIAEQASEKANAVRLQTQSGLHTVSNASQSINALAQDVEKAATAINTLGEQVAGIETILEVIEEIAEQTNLLALNAAIEAARAGEQGRGFAVVADEVRQLAQRSHESTQQIQQMIQRLQQHSHSAVSMMAQGRTQAETSVESASAAGEAFNHIASSIGEIDQLNAAMASAAEEQSQAAEDFIRNLSSINQVSEQTSAEMQQVNATSTSLVASAHKLQTLIAQFKT